MEKVELYQHGFVELLDTLGDDLAVVNNAKVSPRVSSSSTNPC